MKTIISNNVRWLDTPDGLVLLSLANGRCYHMNKAASLVWAGLAANSSDLEIHASLIQRCGVPEQDAHTKYASFLQHFKKLELIQQT
jgi:hypothetical protein